MRRQECFPYPRPPVRPLKIYAFDPMVGLDRRTRVSVDTRNEPLQPGPMGARIAVVDYDASQGCFYVPVDLDDSAILMQGGIDHSEGDPRFHQQMVYAVASRIIEIFDRALGRPVDLPEVPGDKKPRPLRLMPHAFKGANAFFSPDLGMILFGYFPAGASDQGANIPGQPIFSCLSLDVIAHELTHALIYRLSPPKLINSEHPDTHALHEGLADLVPLLHRFSLESVVRDEIQRTRGLFDVSSRFCQIAIQFGHATGMGHALRTVTKAESRQYGTLFEPHERGALLISATLEALFDAYRAQVQDLLGIAGVSALAGGDLHPDLVNRLATEASRAATSLLTMCIRAFDYLPPVDVSFGDFLRAVVTADWELAPDDPRGQRAALIEAFSKRGIYATGARSLAEESLRWERPDPPPEPLPGSIVAALTQTAQTFGRIRPGEGERSWAQQGTRQARKEIREYALRNTDALNLWPDATLIPPTTRYSFRVGTDGQLAVDIIAKFVQKRRGPSSSTEYRGVTLVASADGSVRYVINNQPAPPFKEGARGPAALAPPESEPSLPADEPFPDRYRLTTAEHRLLFPALTLSDSEINLLKRFLNGGDPGSSR